MDCGIRGVGAKRTILFFIMISTLVTLFNTYADEERFYRQNFLHAVPHTTKTRKRKCYVTNAQKYSVLADNPFAFFMIAKIKLGFLDKFSVSILTIISRN